MKVTKIAIIVVLLLFVILQCFRPTKNESTYNYSYEALAEMNTPKKVKTIIKTNCFDCHSNHTEYPWYNAISPVNLILANHISEGKQHLNFSTWSKESIKRRIHKLEEIIEEVSEGEMPLSSYTNFHLDKPLSLEDRNALVAWAQQAKVMYELKQISGKYGQ